MFLLCMNYLTRSTPKIFLVLLEILGFIVSCNLNFIRIIDFTTAIVFNPIVNTEFLCNVNSMALHSLYCADVPLRNCSLTYIQYYWLLA